MSRHPGHLDQVVLGILKPDLTLEFGLEDFLESLDMGFHQVGIDENAHYSGKVGNRILVAGIEG